MSRGMKVMVDPGFPDHRKVRALGRALKIHPMQAVGHVLALWCRVMKECPSGDIRAWNANDVADAAKWEGDPEKLVAALRSKPIRFLEKTEVHDWIEEQGDVIAKRKVWAEERAERRRKEKEKKEREEAEARAREGRSRDTSPPDKPPVRTLSAPDTEGEGQNLSGGDKGLVPPLPSLPVPSRPVPPTGGGAADTPPTPPEQGEIRPPDGGKPGESPGDAPSEAPARTGGEQDADPFAQDLEAFAAFRTPGAFHKREAFEDLIRQGVTHERIRQAAKDHPAWDFYEVVKALRNGKGHQGQGRPNPPKAPPGPPRSETQRKLDAARAAADQKLAELPAEDLATWTKDAEAQAERDKVPVPLRGGFVKTILRVRAARQFGIEGV